MEGMDCSERIGKERKPEGTKRGLERNRLNGVKTQTPRPYYRMLKYFVHQGNTKHHTSWNLVCAPKLGPSSDRAEEALLRSSVMVQQEVSRSHSA
eukprot:scaffold422151_cov23-Prasinocladus_malaysianus.AAC.1